METFRKETELETEQPSPKKFHETIKYKVAMHACMKRFFKYFKIIKKQMKVKVELEASILSH
jgi:hypothetical protein